MPFSLFKRSKPSQASQAPLAVRTDLGFWETLQQLGNSWRFARQKKIYRPKEPPWPPANWISIARLHERLQNSPALRQRQQHLLTSYPALEGLLQPDWQAYWEALAMLDTLDWLYERQPAFWARHGLSEAPLRVLDVGCKNAYYLAGQLAFAEKVAKDWSRRGIDWTGVELDGYRRYANGFSRADYGRQMARYCEGFYASRPTSTEVTAHYHLGCATEMSEKADLILCCLPFVFADTALAWGLPAQTFQPITLLKHLLGLLAPGGMLVTTHLGAEEASVYGDWLQHLARETPAAFNKSAPLRYTLHPVAALPETFITYSQERKGWLCRNTQAAG